MNPPSKTAREIAEIVGGCVEGDESVQVHWIAPVDQAGEGQLTFAADEKYAAKLAESDASVAIVGDQPESAPMTLIRVPDVQAAVATLLTALAPQAPAAPPGVHPSAVVDETATVEASASVGPFVSIGPDTSIASGAILLAGARVGAGAVIGEDTRLCENAVIADRCRVGARCVIGPNTTVGFTGFGYFTQDGVHQLVPHVGDVVIEDDVEIGANSCVDRAKFGSTRIGAGTKIDNLVQVAHNVQVGKGCLLVGQCGIAGSAELGDYVVLGGHAGVRDNIEIGSQVQASAFCAVAQDVPAGETVAGIPALPARQALRVSRAQEKLPDLLKRVKTLEAKVKELDSSENA
jgi:UDP-3-O-[3-hydroxymyristoyl] glucosamine N-acyltransferase